MIIHGRAHTPEQKRAVVERLLTAWLRHPHLRLGQLLRSATDPCSLFYIEDECLVAMVEEMADGRKP